MSMLLSGREWSAGSCPGGARCVVADIRLRCFLHGCCLLALMLSTLSRAEFADTLFAEAAIPAEAIMPIEASPAEPAGEVLTIASFGPSPLSETPVVVEYAPVSPATRVMRAAPGDASIVERYTEAMHAAPPKVSLHFDDITTATGFADMSIRALALALDAEVPRMGGVTIQPRVEMAYRPAGGGLPSFMDSTPEVSATGLAVRLYGSKPTRLSGIYPFVEADWWQDNRSKVININGTRIDPDLLRGLFSFNVGAHSNSKTGMKVWFKVKAGSNPSGTIGARYRW